MVENVLVKEYLPENQITAGEKLLKCLESLKIPVTAAFWILEYERGYWKLMVVSPLVEKIGESKVFTQVMDVAMAEPRKTRIDIVNGLRVLGAKDRFYKRVRESIRTPTPLYDYKLSTCVVAGDLADLYFYRFPATSTPKTKRGLKHA